MRTYQIKLKRSDGSQRANMSLDVYNFLKDQSGLAYLDYKGYSSSRGNGALGHTVTIYNHGSRRIEFREANNTQGFFMAEARISNHPKDKEWCQTVSAYFEGLARKFKNVPKPATSAIDLSKYLPPKKLLGLNLNEYLQEKADPPINLEEKVETSPQVESSEELRAARIKLIAALKDLRYIFMSDAV